MTFAKEAWPFVVPFVVLAAVLFYFQKPAWGWGAAIVALCVLLFFRDPRRRFDGDPRIVVAAADGLVTRVDVVEDPAVGPGRWNRVVTFLSVFDVHVQRVPVEGRVIVSALARGKKVAAFRADADKVNELYLNVIRRPNGDLVGVKQIAGLLARRVVSYLELDQEVARGQHLGVIKFGSRVDVFVPEHYEVLVRKGDRLKNGATPLARPGPEPRPNQDDHGGE